MDPQITSAVISALGGIVAAAVAGIPAVFVGRVLLSRKRLKADLEDAVADIDFLLKVEAKHCALNQETSGASNKNRVRELVRREGGTWSSKFTPGRHRSNTR